MAAPDATQLHLVQLNSTQLFITLIAGEMHSTITLTCKNYEAMKNQTFHFEHVRLYN